MKSFFWKIQTTSNWPQIWCGGWNWDLIEAYQISAKSETKNFLRFGLVCFGHKSEDERPPFQINIKIKVYYSSSMLWNLKIISSYGVKKSFFVAVNRVALFRGIQKSVFLLKASLTLDHRKGSTLKNLGNFLYL